MNWRHHLLLYPLVAQSLVGCDGATRPGSKAEPPRLGPEETFDWGGQPIAFSLPGEDWSSGKEQSGGQRGIAFVLTGGKGTGISVVEMFSVGNRDRCGKIRQIIKELSLWRRDQVLHELQRAHLFTRPVLYDEEVALATKANQYLDSARRAYATNQFLRVRPALHGALETAGKINYRLEHVQDIYLKVLREKKQLPKGKVTKPRPISVGGCEAVTFDYEFYEDWRKTTFHGREVFVVRNNRLFRLNYIGTRENLAVFDLIVDSVNFPEGVCEH